MDRQRLDRLHVRFGVVLLLQFGLLFWLVAFDRAQEMRVLLNLTGVIVSLSAIGVASDRTSVRWMALALAVAAMTLSGGALSGLRPGNVDAGPMLAAALSAYATWVLLGGVVRCRNA